MFEGKLCERLVWPEVSQLPVVQYKVRLSQLNDIHAVVQDHRVGCLYKPGRWINITSGSNSQSGLPLHFIGLFERHLGQVVGVGTNLEFAGLKTTMSCLSISAHYCSPGYPREMHQTSWDRWHWYEWLESTWSPGSVWSTVRRVWREPVPPATPIRG